MKNRTFKLVGGLGIVAMSLIGCDDSNTSSSSAEKVEMTAALKLNAAYAQSISAPSFAKLSTVAIAENIVGQMVITDLSDNSTETIDWPVSLDEAALTISSNQTRVMAPGSYDFALTVVKGNRTYFGQDLGRAIADGLNSTNMSVKPVIGVSGASVDLDRIANLKFEFSSAELSGLTDPKLGYSLDGGIETVVNIDPATGLSTIYMELVEGSHNLDLKLYDGGTQVGKSIDAQETISFVYGSDVALDIVPLHAQMSTSLSLDGGDATFNFVVPAEVINEAGGLAELETKFKLASAVNGNKEEIVSLTLSGANYVGSHTFTGFHFDIVDLELEFKDLGDGELLGNGTVSDLDVSSVTPDAIFDITLRRRAVVSGAILGVVELHVYDENGNPAQGASITIGGELKGITNSQGALKLFLPAGVTSLDAELAGAVGSASETIEVLGLHNASINLAQPSTPAEAPAVTSRAAVANSVNWMGLNSSGSDLINGGDASAAVSSITGTTNATVFSGVQEGPYVDHGANLNIGEETVINFDVTSAPSGYNITKFYAYFGNKNAGDMRNYTVSYQKVGSSTWEPVTTIVAGNQTGSWGSANWGDDTILGAQGGAFMTNVAAVKILWNGYLSGWASIKVWEIDMEGTPAS